MDLFDVWMGAKKCWSFYRLNKIFLYKNLIYYYPIKIENFDTASNKGLNFMANHSKFTNKLLLFVIVVSMLQSFILYNSIKHDNRGYDDRTGSFMKFETPQSAIHFEWNETIATTGSDIGRSIVIDHQGSVYFAGQIYNETEGFITAFLAKYDSEGNLWASGRPDFSAGPRALCCRTIRRNTVIFQARPYSGMDEPAICSGYWLPSYLALCLFSLFL